MFRKNAGFTIIEITVTVAIIGILGSIVGGAVKGSRDEALRTSLVLYAGEFQKAMELYYNANGHYPPLDSDPGEQGFVGGYIESDDPASFAFFESELAPYIDVSPLADGTWESLVGDESFFRYNVGSVPQCTPEDYAPGQTYILFFHGHNGPVEPFYMGTVDGKGRYNHCIEPDFLLD